MPPLHSSHPWPRRPPELLADPGVDDVFNANRGDPLADAERLLLQCGEKLFGNLLCGRVPLRHVVGRPNLNRTYRQRRHWEPLGLRPLHNNPRRRRRGRERCSDTCSYCDSAFRSELGCSDSCSHICSASEYSRVGKRFSSSNTASGDNSVRCLSDP
jgi:hypothetical protein